VSREPQCKIMTQQQSVEAVPFIDMACAEAAAIFARVVDRSVGTYVPVAQAARPSPNGPCGRIP
jgi:cytidine deaminase